MPLIFRGTRIRDLRSFLISDACVDVNAPFRALRDDIKLSLKQSFANHDPMAEVTAELQLREMPEQLLSDPGIVENASTMCLMSNWNSGLRFKLKRLAEVLL